MTRKKIKKHHAHISKPIKVQEEPIVRETTESTNKLPKSNKESLISIFLGALIVIIIGVIVYNYFSISRVSSPEITAIPTEKPLPTITLTPTKVLTAMPTKVIRENILSYKVAFGDSLWTIAQKFYNDGYKWSEIAKINKLENPDGIEVGMTLAIPRATVKPGMITPAAVSTVGPKAITGTVYKVSEGDYLWEIAVRACGDGYKWSKLAEDNKIGNPDIIHPGNIIKIRCK